MNRIDRYFSPQPQPSEEMIIAISEYATSFHKMHKAKVFTRKNNGNKVICFARHHKYKDIYLCSSMWLYHQTRDKFVPREGWDNYLMCWESKKKMLFERFVKPKFSNIVQE